MKGMVVCGFLLFGSFAYASGNQNTTMDFSKEIKKKANAASPKTFKCNKNESLSSCTKRYRKAKAMMEGN